MEIQEIGNTKVKREGMCDAQIISHSLAPLGYKNKNISWYSLPLYWLQWSTRRPPPFFLITTDYFRLTPEGVSSQSVGKSTPKTFRLAKGNRAFSVKLELCVSSTALPPSERAEKLPFSQEFSTPFYSYFPIKAAWKNKRPFISIALGGVRWVLGCGALLESKYIKWYNIILSKQKWANVSNLLGKNNFSGAYKERHK